MKKSVKTSAESVAVKDAQKMNNRANVLIHFIRIGMIFLAVITLLVTFSVMLLYVIPATCGFIVGMAGVPTSLDGLLTSNIPWDAVLSLYVLPALFATVVYSLIYAYGAWFFVSWVRSTTTAVVERIRKNNMV